MSTEYSRCMATQIDRKVAMESFDHEWMKLVGLVADADAWKKKEIRYNTKTLYTQNK